VADDGDRRRHIRTIVLTSLMIVALGLLLTRCPSTRDGMPGQLAQSMEQTVAAARSGAFALDLRIRDRATTQLTSVQISDARDEVLKAYKGVADLEAGDPTDIRRQDLLTTSMTRIIGQLNLASASVRGAIPGPPLPALRNALLGSADALESGYR
jgi:hypothetical protein